MSWPRAHTSCVAVTRSEGGSATYISEEKTSRVRHRRRVVACFTTHAPRTTPLQAVHVVGNGLHNGCQHMAVVHRAGGRQHTGVVLGMPTQGRQGVMLGRARERVLYGSALVRGPRVSAGPTQTRTTCKPCALLSVRRYCSTLHVDAAADGPFTTTARVFGLGVEHQHHVNIVAMDAAH